MAKIIIVGDRRTLRQKAFKAFNIPEQNAYIANTKERAAAEFFRAYPQEDICSVDAGSLELDNSFSASIAWTTKEALQRLMDITTGNLRSFLAGKGNNIVNP